MTYRMAICDDSPADRHYVMDLAHRWAEHAGHMLLADSFPSAESFLFHDAEKGDYDILLLDIEMGAMDGVALARQIRARDATVQIVFITGFADFIAEGYEVAALHYLMKPVREDKLFSVLDRAVAALSRAEPALLLPVDGEMRRVPISQIQYVEAFAHSVSITMDGDVLQVKLPISEVEKMLDSSVIRCHRSYLVGLKYIARLSRTEVILDSGQHLPLSRSAAPLVHKAFIAYYTGEAHETV